MAIATVMLDLAQEFQNDPNTAVFYEDPTKIRTQISPLPGLYKLHSLQCELSTMDDRWNVDYVRPTRQRRLPI